jgi:hypothetical protein
MLFQLTLEKHLKQKNLQLKSLLKNFLIKIRDPNRTNRNLIFNRKLIFDSTNEKTTILFVFLVQCDSRLF